MQLELTASTIRSSYTTLHCNMRCGHIHIRVQSLRLLRLEGKLMCVWHMMTTAKVYHCWIHLHRGNDPQFQHSMKPNQTLLLTSQMEVHIISESWEDSLQHSLVCSFIRVGFLLAKHVSARHDV